MERFQSSGRLIAGVSFDIPGMGYKDPPTGAITGFEADLARATGEKLFGAADRVDLVQVMDAGRISALDEGRVDVVISQLTITPDRAAEVDFSVPYLVTREGLLVRKGSGIKGFDDLKGKRIVATAGSVSIRRMHGALSSLPGATLTSTPLSAGNVVAVERGDADAASNDMVNLTFLWKGAPDRDQYEIIDIGDRFDPKPFGMAVKKGNTDLVTLLNGAIESLKASGTIAGLLDAAIASVGAEETRKG